MYRKFIYLFSIVLALGLVGVANGAEGLLGKYYHGTSSNPWNNLILERIDPTVDFNWGGSSPDPSMNADGFTVRWKVRLMGTDKYEPPQVKNPAKEYPVVLASNLKNTRHTLQLKANDSTRPAIRAIRVYRPPMK